MRSTNIRPRHTGFFWPLLLATILLVVQSLSADEASYNGIRQPAEWPPRLHSLPARLPPPPYLTNPPKLIAIDVGRQLFVDDFLIEHTDLERRFHKPVYHPANPVLTYDKPWEMSNARGGLPTACPYSGGVWYDPARKKFRMWYMGGYIEHLCLAESDDGVHWLKPELDVRTGTNIVLWKGATESNSLLMDLSDKDPNKRFKYFLTNISKGWKTEYRYSADGVHWSDPAWYSGPHGDRTTVFYNPFRKRWVFSLRTSDRSGLRQGRSKRYWETADINDGSTVHWPAAAPGRFDAQAPLWVSADRGRDAPRAEVGVSPQLYHLDCVAYESLMLGMFSILRGDFHENDGEGRDAFPGRPKCAEVCLGYSRDGFHWHRPTHETFAGISEEKGAWNWGNVQSAGNSFLVVGDHLFFYVSGRRGAGDFQGKDSGQLSQAYAGCSTGLAVLRRDGFASMDSPPSDREEFKSLTTRKLRFRGSHFFVNVAAAQGELQVEVLDAEGKVIQPFSRANCRSVRGADHTLRRVTWEGADDLSMLAGKPVRFRFHLANGSLYAFWVSPDKSGASQGYVAGGGPGFSSSSDEVGIGSYPTPTANYQPLFAVPPRTATANPKSRSVPSPDGLVMWLKADAIEGATDGEQVAQWRDSSDNGMDCVQDNKQHRPQWTRAAIGSQPALRFDGRDDRLLTDHYPGLFHSFHKSTIFIVAKPAGGEGGVLLSQAHTSLSVSKLDRLVYTSSFAKSDGAVLWPQIQSTTSEALRAKRPFISGWVRASDKPGDASLLLNGLRVDRGDSAVPYHVTSPIAAYVGCGYRQRNHWRGDIAEVIVYDRALPTRERKLVERYLMRKYDIGLDKVSP